MPLQRQVFSFPQALQGHEQKEEASYAKASSQAVKKVPWEVSEGPKSLRLQSYRVGVFDSFLRRAGGEVSAAGETIPYIFHGRQPWLTVKNAKAFLEKVTAVTLSTRKKEEASYAEASSFIIFLATIPFTPLRARPWPQELPWLPAWRLPDRLRPPPCRTPALQIPTASWSRRTAGSPW